MVAIILIIISCQEAFNIEVTAITGSLTHVKGNIGKEAH
jgi:hypothetical protein